MKKMPFLPYSLHNIPLSAVMLLLLFLCCSPAESREPASTNIPLDSPIYLYLDKLIGLGLITSDIRGIKPYSRAEAARMALEAEHNLEILEGRKARFAAELVARIKQLTPREVSIKTGRDEVPVFSVTPISSARLTSVYLDGAARSYERPVHDPGNDGVFGIGSGLRPVNPYPSPVQQHGVEGTPLLEGNEGARYLNGVNLQFQFSSEAYLTGYSAALIEPLVLYQRSGDTSVYLNKGYLKLGGGSFEVEIGRDAAWLGPGNRTAITLSNNSRNLDLVKLSSPEPVAVPYLGALKYALLLSRLDRSETNGVVRQPWFYALKLSVKPTKTLEIGLNLGRQQGGPGVSNSFGDTVRGLLGGTGSDNSNSVAGFDVRMRFPALRNMELYGELSGEDTASFWPIVESYVAGIYLPNLTSDGRNEMRLEYYYGNNILSSNSTFPEGYLYRGMNLGPFQGGAAQQLFARLTHFFSARNYLSLDYIRTLRGNQGTVRVNNQGNFDPQGTLQAEERANAGRISWNFPVSKSLDMSAIYAFEKIENFNLRSGVDQNNHLVRVNLGFNY
jgi:hypothetical protein